MIFFLNIIKLVLIIFIHSEKLVYIVKTEAKAQNLIYF
jgi:hypothetical protein